MERIEQFEREHEETAVPWRDKKLNVLIPRLELVLVSHKQVIHFQNHLLKFVVNR